MYQENIVFLCLQCIPVLVIVIFYQGPSIHLYSTHANMDDIFNKTMVEFEVRDVMNFYISNRLAFIEIYNIDTRASLGLLSTFSLCYALTTKSQINLNKLCLSAEYTHETMSVLSVWNIFFWLAVVVAHFFAFSVILNARTIENVLFATFIVSVALHRVVAAPIEGESSHQRLFGGIIFIFSWILLVQPLLLDYIATTEIVLNFAIQLFADFLLIVGHCSENFTEMQVIVNCRCIYLSFLIVSYSAIVILYTNRI